MNSCFSSRQAMISGTFGNPWQKSYINKIRTRIGSSKKYGEPIFVSTNKQSTRIMKLFKTLALAAVLVSGNAFSQERSVEEVYSMMVYNFTKYVQWPDHAVSGEFVIGVVGSGEMYKILNEWYGGKPRGSKTYVIKKFNSAAEVTDCHVLYIDKTKSNDFDVVNNKVKGKGTLVITDKSGLGEKGSAINFKMVDNKLKFELNQKAIEASNLKVSGALTSMAILI
jgi:hypothetical protein